LIGRPFVVGVDGVIGGSLSNWLKTQGRSVLETTRRANTVSEGRFLLDLSGNLISWEPPCVVSTAYICAAVTSIERCQKEPVLSARINVQNTVELANRLASNGAFIVFLSSNLVYDGSVPFQKPDDLVSPQTEYGRQKASAERQLLLLGDSVAIVRVTKVGATILPLIRRWAQDLKNNQPIYPFEDVAVSPISIEFATEAICRIGETRLPGVFQLSGQKDILYKQIGLRLARWLGVSIELVRPIPSEGAVLQAGAKRCYATLDARKSLTEIGMEPPDVWATIDALIQKNVRPTKGEMTKVFEESPE